MNEVKAGLAARTLEQSNHWMNVCDYFKGTGEILLASESLALAQELRRMYNRLIGEQK